MSDLTYELPTPDSLESEASMLTKRFGREVYNYFSGSPLNRVSFLRTDNKFLTLALHHATTSFLLFNELKPLTSSPAKLEFVSFKDVKPLIGENPYAKSEQDLIKEYDSSITIPQMVFLGLDERKKEQGLSWKDQYKGAPVFALDVTPTGTVKDQATSVIKEMESRGFSFLAGRILMSFPAAEGAIYAQGRAMLDWNSRNPFCAGCGQPTLSVNAGGKRACPPNDMASLKGAQGSTTATPGSDATQRPPCKTRQGISNLSFPRTDPTIIVAAVSSDNTKLLLGRQKTWPPYWYSTLAGFCEPAESIEEAVRREVWEEAGVTLGRVVIHSTQPWPYPANLMIGAIGQVRPDAANINLGNDEELDNAKWFTFDEIREALRNGVSNLGDDPGPNYKEGNLRVPPPSAIAHQLMRAVVLDGFVTGDHKL